MAARKKAPSAALIHRRKSKWKARKYQRLSVNHILRTPGCGVFLDPGLGKSSICLDACVQLREHKMFKSALVVSTLRGAKQVWADGEENERDKWNFPLTCTFMHGARKEDTLASDDDLRVINWDGLDWLARNWGKVKHRPDVLIIDESTKGKNPGARRSKALMFLRQHFKRVIILTGTPSPRTMEDLWGQMLYVDGGKALGRYLTQFRSKYMVPGTRIRNPHKEAMLARGVPRHRVPDFITTEWNLREGAEAEIWKAIDHLVIRFSDKEIGIKEPVTVPIWVELDAVSMDAYLAAEEEVVEGLEDGTITVRGAGARTIRQRQIANGGLYDSDTVKRKGKRPSKTIHTLKSEAVVDLVEELNGAPLLVGFEFTHDRDRLLEALGKDTPYIDGSVSLKDSARISAEFNRGEHPVLLAQTAAVAHALNLQQACSHVCFHSMTYDLEVYIQFLKRVNRGGQKKRVMVYRILARDTVDEDMAQIIDVKDENQRSIMSRFEKSSRARLRRMKIVRGRRSLAKAA